MQLPPIEARVSAQERMQTILHARIEELAQDMAASFKQQVEYQIYFEQKVDARFDKLDSRINTFEQKVDARFDKLDSRVGSIESKVNTIDSRVGSIESRVGSIDSRVTAIEAKMATKEDIAALEKRMIDIFQQLLTAINQQLHPPENK